MKKWIAALGAPSLCLVFMAVFLGEIYFFRPLPLRNLPKISWAAAAIACGILAGLSLAFLYRQVGRKIPAPKFTAALMLILAGTAALLPGPHHPDVAPNSLTAASLEISLLPNSGEVIIQNIFLNEKRVDWPSTCALSGVYEQTTNLELVLKPGSGPNRPDGKIQCQLYPPKAGSKVQS